MSAAIDIAHMAHALRLGRRALGTTWPNPAVGCVIVSQDGRVLGRGKTGAGGRPHAETEALAAAQDAARGATAYVTLEPCAHHGQTPPCAEALIEAGVARVVIGCEDIDPRVCGKGVARLRDAGIAVTTGVLEKACRESHAGFFMLAREGRPLVTLKLAQSLDGRIASSSGESKWITSEEARCYAHLLRMRHDAILVGIETVLADDPQLTARLPGREPSAGLRVVLDTRLRLNEWSRLARTAREFPTVVFTAATPSGPLQACGVEVVQVGRDARGRPDIAAVLLALGQRGLTRLLVEGGATIHASLLDRRLADRLEVFMAPLTLGGAGHPAIGALAALSLDEAPRFVRTGTRRLGPDLLESYAATA